MITTPPPFSIPESQWGIKLEEALYSIRMPGGIPTHSLILSLENRNEILGLGTRPGRIRPTTNAIDVLGRRIDGLQLFWQRNPLGRTPHDDLVMGYKNNGTEFTVLGHEGHLLKSDTLPFTHPITMTPEGRRFFSPLSDSTLCYLDITPYYFQYPNLRTMYAYFYRNII